jgi:YD repeat-containing protein
LGLTPVGRRKSETTGNRTRSWTYDAAGNVTTESSSLGSITMTYDSLNRLVSRAVPGRKVPRGVMNSSLPGFLPGQEIYFPYFRRPISGMSNLQDSIVVFADTATFLYDVNGNLLVADNRDAQIRRSYFASGQLRSDSLRPARYTWVAEAIAPVFSGSWFIQGYSYDLSGKRLARSTDHTSCSGCIQSYHHEPQSGLLDWTEDRGSPSGTRLASRSATTERGAS